MCSSGIITSIALFLSNLVVAVICFGLWSPVYKINGPSEAGIVTYLKYDLWRLKIWVNGRTFSFHFSDAILAAIDESADFNYRRKLTLAFLFTTMGISVIILILSFLQCCKVLKLEEGIGNILCIIFSFLLVIAAIVTAAIPTIEMQNEKTDFNDIKERGKSYYFEALMAFASTHPGVDNIEERDIKGDLQNAQLKLKVGWVLIVMWVATPVAFISFLLFLMVRLCICMKNRKGGNSNSNYSPPAEEKGPRGGARNNPTRGGGGGNEGDSRLRGGKAGAGESPPEAAPRSSASSTLAGKGRVSSTYGATATGNK